MQQVGVAALEAPPLPCGGSHLAVVRRLVDLGEARTALVIVLLQVEARVDHPEWLEDLPPQELVQRQSGDHLNQPTKHVSRVRVPPRLARVVCERQAAEAVDKLGEAHVGGRVRTDARALVQLVEVRLSVAVAEASRVHQQVSEGDLAPRAHGLAVLEDLRASK